MTLEQMIFYLENPDQLNDKTLSELKEILDEYPYFQSAHLLYVRNLLNEKNFRFASQLKTSAIHITDRSVLYQLLNPQTNSTEKEASKIEQKKKQPDRIPLEGSYQLEGEVDSAVSLAQLVKDINESAVRHRHPLRADIPENSSEEDYPSPEEEGEPDVNEEFITETLARIYIKQGLYKNAIDAFQRLKLKYPEKSIYFARQIDEVTNLLNK
jgi:tetratricopeptide (TPR) repeat protein